MATYLHFAPALALAVAQFARDGQCLFEAGAGLVHLAHAGVQVAQVAQQTALRAAQAGAAGAKRRSSTGEAAGAAAGRARVRVVMAGFLQGLWRPERSGLC